MLRTGYIGGSDIASVLNLEPWGCARKLWYQKTGAPEDQPFIETGAIEIGKAMEAYVAGKVSEQTGWKLRNRAAVKGAEHEGAHIDRHIVSFDDRGPGVLEIKIVGEHTFRKWRNDGISIGYLLQLQWYQYLTGWQWGAIGAWNREHTGASAVKLWEFAYDADLALQVSVKVDEFWTAVERRVAPPPLEDRDSRCESCQWQATCLSEEWSTVAGENRRDDLEPLVSKYIQLKAIEKDTKEAIEVVRVELEPALGDSAVTVVGGSKITFKPQESWRVGVDVLKTKYPDIYERVLQRSVSRPLRVTKAKEK